MIQLGCPATPAANACGSDLDCPGYSSCDLATGLCLTRDARAADVSLPDSSTVDGPRPDTARPDVNGGTDHASGVDSSSPDRSSPDTQLTDAATQSDAQRADHVVADLPTCDEAGDRDMDAAVPPDRSVGDDRAAEDAGLCGHCPEAQPYCSPQLLCVECFDSSHCEGRTCNLQTHRCPRPGDAG
ncbi:MAG: hypothetical protein ABIJ09_19100 [Pseudomonadota bacterium]